MKELKNPRACDPWSYILDMLLHLNGLRALGVRLYTTRSTKQIVVFSSRDFCVLHLALEHFQESLDKFSHMLC